jgi:hypothetical protein
MNGTKFYLKELDEEAIELFCAGCDKSLGELETADLIYTLTVTVRDHVCKQTIAQQRAFTEEIISETETIITVWALKGFLKDVTRPSTERKLAKQMIERLEERLKK